jgi:hypothetical protein
MNANKILQLLNLSATDKSVEDLFVSLNTLSRPSLPDDEDSGSSYHDWVLARRKGVELGFADSNYHTAAAPTTWGYGKLLLTQVYFYSGFDDIDAYTGELPFGLEFTDNRNTVRAKLAALEATRHSYRTDTWDVDSYRLSVTYTDGGKSIDRMACLAFEAPIPRRVEVDYPDLKLLSDAFGCTIRDLGFLVLWQPTLADDKLQEARKDEEIDLLQTYGALLSFANSRKAPIFRSITLHRNRHRESVGWAGKLPQGLDFEDSPETLFRKIPVKPVQQSDPKDVSLTGHAVWHFEDYTLHVLYSNLDNRLYHVKMIAPGTWKSVFDTKDG